MLKKDNFNKRDSPFTVFNENRLILKQFLIMPSNNGKCNEILTRTGLRKFQFF
jgi:hypothetical protein